MKAIITAAVVTKMSDLSLIWFLTCCPLSELFRGWLRKSDLRLVGWKGSQSVTSVVYMSVHVWVCGGQGKHTYTGHLGEGWVCNSREEEKGGGLPFLSLSEVWMQQHREVSGKSERNSWYFKRNSWAPTCFTLILFLSSFKSNKLSLEAERKGFCLKKMSDSGVNPHLEGIISDFEGLLCIFLHFFHSICKTFSLAKG